MIARIAITGAVLASAGFIALPGVVGPASADPLCERRSAAHVAEHGGYSADNVWHIAHSELPTCERGEQGTDHNRDDEDGGQDESNGDRWNRDEFGFHCTWSGCG